MFHQLGRPALTAPEFTIELAGPKAHYFFGCAWTACSLVGGTMFFSRM